MIIDQFGSANLVKKSGAVWQRNEAHAPVHHGALYIASNFLKKITENKMPCTHQGSLNFRKILEFIGCVVLDMKTVLPDRHPCYAKTCIRDQGMEFQ